MVTLVNVTNCGLTPTLDNCNTTSHHKNFQSQTKPFTLNIQSQNSVGNRSQYQLSTTRHGSDLKDVSNMIADKANKITNKPAQQFISTIFTKNEFGTRHNQYKAYCNREA